LTPPLVPVHDAIHSVESASLEFVKTAKSASENLTLKAVENVSKLKRTQSHMLKRLASTTNTTIDVKSAGITHHLPLLPDIEVEELTPRKLLDKSLPTVSEIFTVKIFSKFDHFI
jgi:hypothetical protein